MTSKDMDSKIPKIFAAALIVAGIVFFSSCGAGGEKQAAAQPAAAQALPVSVVPVQKTDLTLTGDWVGTMDGYVNAQIQPQVTGYLLRQNYREGSTVKKDDVLFEIDPRPFAAILEQAEGQLGQAKGQLAQAQAQLGLAEINVKRDTPLAEARAIARSQLDTETQQKAQAEAAVGTAKAQIAAADAAIASAKLNLGFTKVRSLIDGVAGQATTQVGNLVSPQSVLTSVSQLNPIKVFFSISDSEYLALTKRAQAQGGSLLRGTAKFPLTLTLSNGQTYGAKGHIVFVDRQMNAQTGAIRIAAAFPNPGNILRPGQFGRITAETEARKGALLVPQVAVMEMQGIQQVYTVGEGNKVHVVNVKLGRQYGKNWVIEDGLSPDAQVITDNLQKLKEGMPVAPQAPKPEAGSASAAGN